MTGKCYATLHYTKIHTHITFRIPTSKNIYEIYTRHKAGRIGTMDEECDYLFASKSSFEGMKINYYHFSYHILIQLHQIFAC